MAQNISTLMDGELYRDEADQLLGHIKKNPAAQQDWSTYHLIGDVLRQSDYLPSAMPASFFERLQAEPTVLVSLRPRSSKAGIFAMSAAASVMAVAFLGWLSVHLDTTPLAPQVQKVSSATLRAARLRENSNFPSNGSMNDYLLAHQKFSPGTDVRGASSYIRTVSTKQAMAGE